MKKWLIMNMLQNIQKIKKDIKHLKSQKNLTLVHLQIQQKKQKMIQAGANKVMASQLINYDALFSKEKAGEQIEL